MSKIAKVQKSPVQTAKEAELTAKRMLAEGKRDRALAMRADKGAVAFAGSGMHELGRGAFAAVLCASGPGTYSFAAIAKAAGQPIADLSGATLRYIARNFAFRADLVGFAVAFDVGADTIVVRLATRDEKLAAIKRAASLTGRSVATVASVTGFALEAAPRATSRRSKGKGTALALVEAETGDIE